MEKNVHKSCLTNQEMLLAYEACLLPSLRYKLLSTNMSYEECEKIEDKIKPVLFNSHGLHRNCARIILFTSHMKVGLNHHHIYHLQGFEKLKFFLMHMRRTGSTTNKLLRISMNYTQMELGTKLNFWECSYKKLNAMVTHTWITSLWQFMESCNGAINMNPINSNVLPRENDFYLIDALIESNVPMLQIRMFNQIRLKMKLKFASDVVVIGKGKRILPNIMRGENYRSSKNKWPCIHAFPKKWLENWQYILKSVIQSKLDNNPLGAWLGQSHQSWTHFSSENGRIVASNRGRWEKQQHKYCFQKESLILPQYADFDERKQKLYGRGNIEIYPYSMENDEPRWWQSNWGVQPSFNEFKNLHNTIKSRVIVGVSDGSVTETKAGHAWCFSDVLNENVLMEGAAIVHGDIRELNSYRAEAMGVLALVTIIAKLESIFKTGYGNISIYCDSRAVVQKIKKDVESSTKYSMENDIDAILAIRSQIKKMRTNIQMYHVKGHMDRDIPFEDLPIQFKMNCVVDKKVGDFLESYESVQSTEIPFLEDQVVGISVAGKNCVHNVKQKLVDEFFEPEWRKYICNKFDIAECQINQIDWDSIRRCLVNHKMAKGQIIKVIHNQLNTMKMNHKWKTSPNATCPCCGIKDETMQHVLQCQHEIMKQVRLREIGKIEKKMKGLNTHPALLNLIIMAITKFSRNETIQSHRVAADSITQHTQQICRDQERIGWLQFHKGIVSKCWSEMQQAHYDNIKIPFTCTVRRWKYALVKQMNEYFRKLWKERCALVQLLKENTVEGRLRSEAYHTCTQMRPKWWTFNVNDRELFKEKRSFFFTSNICAVRMWMKRVQLATEKQFREKKGFKSDIRTYVKKIVKKNNNDDMERCKGKKMRQKGNKSQGDSKQPRNGGQSNKIQQWLVRKNERKKIHISPDKILVPHTHKVNVQEK